MAEMLRSGSATAAGADKSDAAGHVLLLKSESSICALPLESVIETMRPLQCGSVANAPGFLLGVAVIRGAATPVVSLSALLGEASANYPTRFVTIKVGARTAALAAHRVLGVVRLGNQRLQGLPPLLKDASNGALADAGALDERLLLVLQAGRIVPDEVWEALREQGN